MKPISEFSLRLDSPGAVFIALLIMFGLSACERRSPEPEATKAEQFHSADALPPAEVGAIEKEFPGAVPYKKGIDSLLVRLKNFGIPSNTLLWGQSTCVDDIISTKNKMPPDIKGP